MDAVEDYNAWGTDLLNLLVLRTYPIAVKMLKDEGETPAGALRPKRDLGTHYAMCQAFGVVRGKGTPLAMFIDDHWCFEPIIAYGLVAPPEDFLQGSSSAYFVADGAAAKARTDSIPILPHGRYAGMALAPLHKAGFAPDVVMVYCTPSQLRHMTLALMRQRGTRAISTIDPIWSCVHSILPPLLNGAPAVTVPDPGDFERAGAGDDEMIFSLPGGMMREFMEGARHYEQAGMGYRSFTRDLRGDFDQPPFYRDYFKKWGLDEPR
ncbi:MAG: DUF169 domain-containing protein [Acidobacteriota bacterium]|jgi:uncharacterized protein (DUF169 family)|nr:DUF169 domain-containing protein [Acidobacteriota bacterium]